MRGPDTPDEAVRTIRSTTAEVEDLLARMDSSPPDPECSERKGERQQHRVYDCSVSIQQVGASSPTTYLVAVRNLSPGGMSFLHGGFVHPASRCVVRLVTVDDVLKEIAGEVVRCRYVEKMIHEVSVKFVESIATEEYCGAEVV